MDFDLFWNKEKIKQIIDKENTVNKSVIELVKGTVISIIITVAFLSADYFLTKKIDWMGIGVAILLGYLTFSAWIYSFLLAFCLKGFMRNKTPVQDDVMADFLIIINKLQGNNLTLYSIFFSIALTLNGIYGRLADAFSLPMLFPFILLAILFTILSIRMQIFALEYAYKADKRLARQTVIAGNFLVYVVSTILMNFFGLMMLLIAVIYYFSKVRVEKIG